MLRSATCRECCVAARLRDSEKFDACAEQYVRRGGTGVYERKKVHRATVFEVWGGQVEGDAGWMGPPRHKLVGLLWVTFELAQTGVTDLQLLESPLGCWAFFLQFRRPMFAFVDLCYHEGPLSDAPDECFPLSRAAKDELLELSVWGLCMLCCLRAEVEPCRYGVDSSPSALGGCAARVPRSVAEEVWRRGVRIEGSVRAALNEAGREVELSDDDDAEERGAGGGASTRGRACPCGGRRSQALLVRCARLPEEGSSGAGMVPGADTMRRGD